MKNHSLLEPLEARIAPAFASAINLANLSAAAGFKLSGGADNDGSGISVSSAGDVNGDGFIDLIIGANGADEGGTDRGAAYVVFGKGGGIGSLPSLAALDGSNGFKLMGAADSNKAGASVSAAGDVNGDGFDDIIIGAPAASEGGSARGAAYVVFGKSMFDSTVALGSLNGANGFKLRGAADGDAAGVSVSGAGDVNGDGFDDLIVGASGADEGGDDRGAAYVIFGKAGGFNSATSLGTIDGNSGFRIRGFANLDSTGSAVSGAGDVNGDGFDDVIVGAGVAGGGGSSRGASYVVFGKSGSFASAINAVDLDGSDGFRIFGAHDLDIAGFAVGGAGDVNGDGFDDVIVGAPFADEGGNASGAAYVVYGKGSGFEDTISLLTLDAATGFKLRGVADSDHAGFAVQTAGDVNGDGFDDLIVGANLADEGGTTRGAAYVVFGRAGGLGNAVSLSLLNGLNGFKISGVADSDNAGTSVGSAGDLNGDGFADLIVGAPDADEGGSNRGASYVIYGQPDVAVKFTAGGKTATFIDGDGDVVTLKVSKGSLSQRDFDFSGGVWRGLNLSDDGQEFAGANVSVSVKKSPVGDGLVNLGAIHAEGLDLGSVRVPGDLGQIDAGDANLKTPGVKSLSVRSLGALGGTTQPFGTLDPVRSDIVGALGTLSVAGDVKGAVNVTGGLGAKIGKVTISGNLDGSGGGTFAGLLRAGSNIGAVTVKGSIIGGADFSGIIAGGKLGKVAIGGDLTSAMAVQPVIISALGDVTATTAARAVAIASVSIGGDVHNAQILAGYTASLGAANSDASIGAVRVNGDWSASSLVAGVADTGLLGYGLGDTLIAGDTTPNLFATIASVVIKGSAIGSVGGTDSFAVTAQRVAKVQIGGVAQTLTAGVDSFLLDTTNNDFRVRDFV
jgi:hypothetical protein